MLKREEIIAELRLFKAFTVYDEQNSLNNNTISSLEKGILYTRDVTDIIKEEAERLYGLKPDDWNSAFHKSFKTVVDTPIEKLIAQQLIHYFSTYGLESVGMFDNDLVYIPHEKLDIPELEDNIELKVIRNISIEELGERLLSLLTSGIALSKQTIADIMTLSDYIDKEKFDDIKNREVKIALYDKYGVVPKNNMEFLRYLVYKTTNSTLYIQNYDTIQAIKQADKTDPFKYLYKYTHTNNGFIKLAEIFLRNKNIFLAFKTKTPSTKRERELNTIINKISKYSHKYHKPLSKNILDNVYSIKTITELDSKKNSILEALDNITVFREIRILDGLRYRILASKSGNRTDSIVYRIRNGKAYATTFENIRGARVERTASEIYNLIESHLVARLKPVIENKTFYIPDNVTYVAPTSEKQFIGDMPEGSCVSIPRKDNMVIGVHWYDLPKDRVDLDLKMMNKSEHYGWNASYMSSSNDIVFSGDMTSAPKPNGATEAFLISPNVANKSFILTLNDFTQCRKEIPFQLFVSSRVNSELDKNYIIDPNTVLALFNNKFDNTQKDKVTPAINLGYVEINKTDINIYFKNFVTVKGRVSSPDMVNKIVYEYSDLYSKTQITLNDLISKCGGIITDTPNIEKLESVDINGETLYKKVTHAVDYNLAVNVITKDTFIKLLEGV